MSKLVLNSNKKAKLIALERSINSLSHNISRLENVLPSIHNKHIINQVRNPSIGITIWLSAT